MCLNEVIRGSLMIVVIKNGVESLPFAAEVSYVGFIIDYNSSLEKCRSGEAVRGMDAML